MKAERRKPRAGRQSRGLTAPVTIDRVDALSRIQAALTPEQLKVAVWYYIDGYDMPQIAEWLKCSKVAVNMRLDVIDRKIQQAGLPPPKRLEHPTTTDHTIQYEVFDD